MSGSRVDLLFWAQERIAQNPVLTDTYAKAVGRQGKGRQDQLKNARDVRSWKRTHGQKLADQGCVVGSGRMTMQERKALAKVPPRNGKNQKGVVGRSKT